MVIRLGEFHDVVRGFNPPVGIPFGQARRGRGRERRPPGFNPPVGIPFGQARGDRARDAVIDVVSIPQSGFRLVKPPFFLVD
jgi:hypothetical protein